MGHRTYNIQEAEDQFVHGIEHNGKRVWPTYEMLGKLHGCTYTTMMRKGDELNWKQKRSDFREQLEQVVAPVEIEPLTLQAEAFDRLSLSAAERGIQHIVKHLESSELQYGYANKNVLDALARSLINFQKAGRLALGMSTENNSNKTEVLPGIDLSQLTEKELAAAAKIMERVDARQKRVKVIESGPAQLEQPLVTETAPHE